MGAQVSMGQVYIEDYVVSFLKQKKAEAIENPVKLALFGTKESPETRYIYGAAALEESRTITEIGNEYFPAYQFLGYVNVRNSDRETISQYNIFYDENIAMQDYLLYHYMSPNSTFRRPGSFLNQSKASLTGIMKMFILGIACLIMATSVSTIDNYSKLYDFVETTKMVISFNDN
jgi:hypothetical protein